MKQAVVFCCSSAVWLSSLPLPPLPWSPSRVGKKPCCLKYQANLLQPLPMRSVDEGDWEKLIWYFKATQIGFALSWQELVALQHRVPSPVPHGGSEAAPSCLPGGQHLLLLA